MINREDSALLARERLNRGADQQSTEQGTSARKVTPHDTVNTDQRSKSPLRGGIAPASR